MVNFNGKMLYYMHIPLLRVKMEDKLVCIALSLTRRSNKAKNSAFFIKFITQSLSEDEIDANHISVRVCFLTTQASCLQTILTT